jgi:hypothetical protein
MAVLALIMTTDPEPLRARNAELPPALEAVVMRAMCRDREQRYRSAPELAAALQAAIDRPDDVTWTRPTHTPALVLPPAVAAASQASAPSRSSRPNMLAPPLSSRSLPSGSSRSLPSGSPIPPAAARALSGAASLSGSNASLTRAGASRTYKMLMVAFYLLLVSVLLISLLVDRASCR